MQKSNMPPSSGRSLRGLFLIALMVVVAGCSSLRVAYNHGDTLLYWWIDKYVDLNSDQKISVKDDIRDLFRWHRKTQLLDYVQVLKNGQRQLAGNPSAADLAADYEDIKNRTRMLLTKALPELADLARSLEPNQIATLEKQFASNNDDFRKKNMKGDREAQQKFRYKKSMEQFELWFGSFSAEQEAIIRRASDARPLDNQIWLDERRRRQQSILTLVQRVQREKLSKEATMPLIKTVIDENFNRQQDSPHKAFLEASEQASIQLILTVVKIATPEQKAHAQKRMQGWIDDFNSLAAEVR
jgi:hypothetical protein